MRTRTSSDRQTDLESLHAPLLIVDIAAEARWIWHFKGFGIKSPKSLKRNVVK